MSPLKWSLVAYGLLGVVGTGFVVERGMRTDKASAEIIFTATTDLPLGTRLDPRTFRHDPSDAQDEEDDDETRVTKAGATLTGQYLKKPLRAGARILMPDISAVPNLLPDPGMALINVEIADAGVADQLNAGKPAILCAGDRKVGLDIYRVAAKVCAGPRCAAMIAIAPDEAKNVDVLRSELPIRVENMTCLPKMTSSLGSPPRQATIKQGSN